MGNQYDSTRFNRDDPRKMKPGLFLIIPHLERVNLDHLLLVVHLTVLETTPFGLSGAAVEVSNCYNHGYKPPFVRGYNPDSL